MRKVSSHNCLGLMIVKVMVLLVMLLSSSTAFIVREDDLANVYQLDYGAGLGGPLAASEWVPPGHAKKAVDAAKKVVDAAKPLKKIDKEAQRLKKKADDEEEEAMRLKKKADEEAMRLKKKADEEAKRLHMLLEGYGVKLPKH